MDAYACTLDEIARYSADGSLQQSDLHDMQPLSAEEKGNAEHSRDGQSCWNVTGQVTSGSWRHKLFIP